MTIQHYKFGSMPTLQISDMPTFLSRHLITSHVHFIQGKSILAIAFKQYLACWQATIGTCIVAR